MSVETSLLRGPFEVPAGFTSLVAPVCRASTVTFANADAFTSRRDRFFSGYTYGLAGTPTHYALCARLAVLEQAAHVALAPSGLAAIHLVNQALLTAGDHVLVADSVYGPFRSNANELLTRAGVQVQFYDPLVGGRIDDLLRPNTKLVWCESPGSLTLEVQDVPAIVRACRARDVLVALDNTWASPLGFKALAHGVDLSVQALTKYVGGHADLVLGSVSTNSRALYERLRHTANLVGANVSADDCSAAMRGLSTLAVRLRAQTESAREIAHWLRNCSQVDWMAFPPLPGDAGHAIWARDFENSGTLMSFTLRTGDWDTVRRFVDALRIFQLGASFGGTHSLVAVYRGTGEREVTRFAHLDHLIRLSIGLEHRDDLRHDLAQALAVVHDDCRVEA